MRGLTSASASLKSGLANRAKALPKDHPLAPSLARYKGLTRCDK